MDWSQVTGEHAARLDEHAAELDELRERVALLEQRAKPRIAKPVARGWRAPDRRGSLGPGRSAAARRTGAPSRPRRDLEELLGGRVLGFAGGVAVLLGIAFLVAMAVNRGWLDEQARILLGFGGSAALLVAGLWLHERRGRTQASRAAVAAAIAGLFATLTAATRLYELIPIGPGLAIAIAVGGLATTVAVRWRSRTVAALGIVGALLAPVLVGATPSGVTVAFTLIALTAAATVVVWQRWGALALAAFAVALPQVAAWLASDPSAGATAVVLAAAWVLGTGAALGLAARSEAEDLAPAAALLLGTAVFTAAAGHNNLESLGHETAASLWVAAVALGQLVAGVAAWRSAAIDRDLAALSLAASLAGADVAFVLLADGPVLTIGFAASAVGLMLLARLRGRTEGDGRGLLTAEAAVGAQLALAVAHALAVDVRPDVLAEPAQPLAGPALAIAALTAAVVACARLHPGKPAVGAALDGLGVAAIAYLSAYLFDGSALAVAWAVEAVAVAAVARVARVPYGAVAGAALLSLATVHSLAFDAVPRALVYGAADIGAAALALLAVAGGATAAARLAPADPRELRLALRAVAATALLYLGSVAIVTAFQPQSGVLGTDLTLLSVRQQGQLLLSAFWSVAGVAALVLGLRRGDAFVRWGGFALLGAATAKVFLFDLSALESLYRVGSFVALGLLLLGGAFAYQRLRTGRVSG